MPAIQQTMSGEMNDSVATLSRTHDVRPAGIKIQFLPHLICRCQSRDRLCFQAGELQAWQIGESRLACGAGHFRFMWNWGFMAADALIVFGKDRVRENGDVVGCRRPAFFELAAREEHGRRWEHDYFVSRDNGRRRRW